jgi:hypothetical protein
MSQRIHNRISVVKLLGKCHFEDPGGGCPEIMSGVKGQ